MAYHSNHGFPEGTAKDKEGHRGGGNSHSQLQHGGEASGSQGVLDSAQCLAQTLDLQVLAGGSRTR